MRCILGVSKGFLDEVLGFQGFPRVSAKTWRMVI